MILGFSAIALVTAVVLLAAGARVFEGVARTLSLVATLFAMLQVIAQTGSAVGACLPNYLRRALAVVAPLVLNSIAFTPAPCLMTADGAQGNLFQLFGSQIATFYLAGVLVLVLTLSDIAGRLRRACLSRRIFRGGCNLVAPSTIGKAAGLLILTVQPIALSSAVTLLDCTTVLLPAASAMQLQIWNSGNIMNNSTFSAVTENNNSSSVSSNNSSFVAVTVLRTQPFVICFSPVHAGAAVGAIATLAVLALALPIALYFALVSARYRVLGARSALLSGSLELHHDAEDGGGVKTSNPMASKSRKNSARTVTRPPQQLRAQLGALYATARLDDEKAQAAWVRGDAPMQRRGRCTALQRSCPVRAVRRARVALCCVGRDALSRAHALPPPQPKPYSIAALLARYAPAVHRAIFSPAALPPVTALSVADLALRPRLLVADAAQSAARPGLAAALAELTPAARAAAAAHRADLTSAERLLLSGDYRPSLASLAIADYLAATIIVIVAAALPIFSPDPSRAGLRAGLTVAVCAALGWALAEQKPYVGAAAWKLALRELTLVIYAGCSVLALFCSSCTPDSDALLIVAGITLALMLLVPLIACGALTSNAKQEIEAEDKAPLHSVASEGEVAGNSSVRGSFRAAAPPPPPPPPPPRLLSLQRNTSIGRMPTHRSLHNLPLAGAADGPANEPRRLIAASTPTRISWRNLPVSLRAGGGIRVLQPPPVAASTDMLRAAQPIIVRIASSSDIDSRAGSTRRVAALHVDTGVLIHDKPMRASSRAVFTPQAGRMEGPTRFATTIMRSGTGVAVDLAHTPDALIKPDVLADIAHRRQSMRHMLRN